MQKVNQNRLNSLFFVKKSTIFTSLYINELYQIIIIETYILINIELLIFKFNRLIY